MNIDKIMAKPRGYTYNRAGFEMEVKIAERLKEIGCRVNESTKAQNIRDDIDLFVEGAAVSIKNQQNGLKYGHIYFELATQHKVSFDPNELYWTTEVQSWLAQTPWNPSWYPSWFLTGKATKYLIAQGNVVTLYSKSDILSYIQANGFARTSGLSKAVLAGQSGKNSVCGYLVASEVPYQIKFDLVD